MRMTEVGIIPVWRALGGAPLRCNRGRAFWRDGDGYSVALDTNGDRWFDHARGEGGGVLALVQTVLGIDWRAAAAWLGEHFGIGPIERTPEERRRYAQRIDRARATAAELVERRDSYRMDLRCAAQILLTVYHEHVAVAEAEHDIEKLARAEDFFAKQEEICARRERFATATGPELLALFEMVERGPA
jgi:hypothetical protein